MVNLIRKRKVSFLYINLKSSSGDRNGSHELQAIHTGVKAANEVKSLLGKKPTPTAVTVSEGSIECGRGTHIRKESRSKN